MVIAGTVAELYINWQLSSLPLLIVQTPLAFTDTLAATGLQTCPFKTNDKFFSTAVFALVGQGKFGAVRGQLLLKNESIVAALPLFLTLPDIAKLQDQFLCTNILAKPSRLNDVFTGEKVKAAAEPHAPTAVTTTNIAAIILLVRR
jgi:hypothetical protein